MHVLTLSRKKLQWNRSLRENHTHSNNGRFAVLLQCHLEKVNGVLCQTNYILSDPFLWVVLFNSFQRASVSLSRVTDCQLAISIPPTTPHRTRENSIVFFTTLSVTSAKLFKSSFYQWISEALCRLALINQSKCTVLKYPLHLRICNVNCSYRKTTQYLYIRIPCLTSK